MSATIREFQISPPPSTISNRMDDARIAELLAPFLGESPEGRGHQGAALSPAQLRDISRYIDILVRWNARINLTAVRQPEEIVTRHFGESIFAARHLFPSGHPVARPHVIDVGSGAGFPGLPIKLWVPDVDLTLIESSQKKATFLREVVRNLELTSAEVFAGRADAFAGPRAEVVTLRAVERFESIIPAAAGLVKACGRMVVMIGEAQLKRVRELVPGLKWDMPVRLPLSSNRVMIIGSKES